MPSIAELEASLHARWDLATVEAYGQALRVAGDPRGELIAIDLALDDRPPAEAREQLAKRKQELELQWLGNFAQYGKTKFGFIDGLWEEPDVLIAGFPRFAPFVRRLVLYQEPSVLLDVVRGFVASRWPWLHALELHTYGCGQILVDPALGRRLVDATPALKRLAVRGRFVVDELVHPGVEQLVAEGAESIGALRGRGVMPAVRQLELTVHPNEFLDRPPDPAQLRAGLVTRAAFPALVSLDVSRNEPRPQTLPPNALGGETAILDVIARSSVLPGLHTLRVPSLRTEADARQLQRLLDAMPALRALEVARMYGALDVRLQHPHAWIDVPPPVPWLAASEIREHDALIVRVDDRDSIRVELEHAYRIVETAFDGMAPPARDAWRRIWEAAIELGHDEARVLELPVTMLRDAVVVDDLERDWSQLRDRLATATADHVTVRRIDGYESYDKPEHVERAVVSSDHLVELEHALQQAWDVERLAVYADELLQLGDPRGELISVDLQYERQPTTDLELQHAVLHDRIFGRFDDVTSRFGFAHVRLKPWDDQDFTQLLAGDIARYLRELVLIGDAPVIAQRLVHALSAPRPWLRRLAVEINDAIEGRHVEATALRVQCPYLDELELAMDTSSSLFAGLAHPHVTRLRITGAPALEQLGAPWSRVAELDFAFGSELDLIGQRVMRGLVADKLPALRTLDLSRNEPSAAPIDIRIGSAHRHQGGTVDVFAALADVDRAVLAELRVLRLPSVRRPEHVRAIQAVLDDAPRLERLELARLYPDPPPVELRHARAACAVPAPVSWLPFDECRTAAMRLVGAEIPLRDAADAMELHHAAMPPEARRAWDTLWRDIVADRRRFELPAATLYRAIDALAARDAYAWSRWTRPLLEGLHPLAIADAPVTVELSPYIE